MVLADLSGMYHNSEYGFSISKEMDGLGSTDNVCTFGQCVDLH